MITQNTALFTIFGATGDLAHRKLYPSLFRLYKKGFIKDNFAVIGTARREWSDVHFREVVLDSIKDLIEDKEDAISFAAHFYYIAHNVNDAEHYIKLKDLSESLDAKYSLSGNRIFYLAMSPEFFGTISEKLKEQKLLTQDGFNRLIIEKPFGRDFESADALNTKLRKSFDENQIFRIDHYLGKEMVQNISAVRFSNMIFESLWNNKYIDNVQITLSETVGVEERGAYYDNNGALRDMVQNHLLQLVSLVAMEPPMAIDSESIRNEKLKVFQAMRPMSSDDLFKNVLRGQYTAANIKGKYAKGYREEKDVAPDSRTETYVAMKLFIDNWRWGDVPFYVRTGKRLPTRVSEVVIHFKPAPQRLFPDTADLSNDDNQLVIRIQPDEGILLKTKMKVPGSGYQVKNVNMDFHYSQLQDTYLPEAYERLLLDCMTGDSTLYIRGDALEATWKFVQPLLDFWEKNPDAPLHGYPAGSWGPDCADDLIEGDNLTWRYPCKNLSDDGIYCEL